MALVSTPSRRRRSMFSQPKSSSPTQPMIPAERPSRPTWSMKMAGAPLGKGPTRVPGARKLWPRSVVMISTKISPIVMIRAIRRLLSGATWVCTSIATAHRITQFRVVELFEAERRTGHDLFLFAGFVGRGVLSLMVFDRSQCLGLHDVGIETSLKVVNLVLENPRIPACGVDDTLLSMFIHAGHAN